MQIAPLVPESIAALVMTVDVDELTLGRVRTALRGTEFAVENVCRTDALARVQRESAPVILLFEWLEEDTADPAMFCQAIQKLKRTEGVYFIALGGAADHATLLRATEGHANDALSRPFDRDLLLVRLRHALRTMRATASIVTPANALHEAIEHGNGEVCVRSGDTVARIDVQEGHVVWAHLSSAPATVEEVAAHAGASLDADVIGAVTQECQENEARYMDVLVEWGLVEAEHARKAVRSFATGRVRQILDLPDARALFLPAGRTDRRSERTRARVPEGASMALHHTASTDESFGEPPMSQSRRTPPLPLARLAEITTAATRIQGALGAAVLERKTGACLHHSGADPDIHVAWSQVSALAALGAGAEEVLATAGEHCFITRPLRCAPSLLLFVSFSLTRVSLGLAKAGIALLTSSGAGPAERPVNAIPG